MRRSRTIAALTAVPAVAITLAACGTETLDSEDLESNLVDQLSPQLGVDPADVTASCPEDIEPVSGTEFNCTLMSNTGDEATVDVTLTDDEGGFEASVN